MLRIFLLTLGLCTLPATFAVASSVSVASSAMHAAMAPDANAILAEADKRAAIFADQRYSAAMEIFKGGKRTKTLKFDMVRKGGDKQLITFEAPGDVAGMKVLMEDADTLYLYSPEFKKVRRVAAHTQNQGFLGSTFTYEDMVQTQLSPFFDAKMLSHAGSETALVLAPKADVSSTYPKVEIVIDASKGGVTKLRYYDASGRMVREQIREEWKRIAGQLVPTRITMKDLKSGDQTIIVLSDIKVNQGVPDATFSRRMLMRG